MMPLFTLVALLISHYNYKIILKGLSPSASFQIYFLLFFFVRTTESDCFFQSYLLIKTKGKYLFLLMIYQNLEQHFPFFMVREREISQVYFIDDFRKHKTDMMLSEIEQIANNRNNIPLRQQVLIHTYNNKKSQQLSFANVEKVHKLWHIWVWVSSTKPSTSHISIEDYLKYLNSQNNSSAYQQCQNCLQLYQNCHEICNNMFILSLNVIFVDLVSFDVKISQFADPLRIAYQMTESDTMLQEINKLFVEQCPIPKYKYLLKIFQYENKSIYSAFSMLNCSNMSEVQKSKMTQFLTALELVNLGFSLHHSIGKSQKLNFVTRMALKMMSKQLKDSYLVLGGDYFHIKGSVLASRTNNVELSKLLSEVQIDLCKYVHLTEQLKGKILSAGYDSVDIKQIYNISILKISPIVKGLIAMDVIKEVSHQNEAEQKQIYQIIGLLTLYRKDLQNFMFNFKDIVKKYLEYSANRINFDSEESLPYFIFFKGAQNKRIDISYLNTVTMMSEQIEYLETKLLSLLGDEKFKQLQNKMSYYHMIYS